MNKITVATALLMLVFFAGCSDKQFYKPDNIAGSVQFDKSLPSKIASANAQAATLKNGQFITKDGGVSNFKIPDGYEIMSKKDQIVVVADKLGNVSIFENEKELAKVKFDSRVVAASGTNALLALITADNTALLYDIKSKETLFKQKNEDVLAVHAKIAAPYFLNELVIYPTLDGKLFIYDVKDKKVAKDMVVANEKNFNNIIFLDVVDDRLIAATANKVFSISPKYMNSFDADVADIIFIKNGVYIFTMDGRIILTDSDLRKAGERKFPFARFVGVIYGKYIYAIESQGYLIATDVNLKTSNIFKFSNSIFGSLLGNLFSSDNSFEDYVFTTKDAIYYGDQQFTLAK